MDKTEVLSIEPSREFDALIAEKVFEMGKPWFNPDTGEPFYPGLQSVGIPHFSTNILAAWEIVNELKNKGWLLRLSDCGEWGWNAELFHVSNISSEADIAVKSATPEEAICKVALLTTTHFSDFNIECD